MTGQTDRHGIFITAVVYLKSSACQGLGIEMTWDCSQEDFWGGLRFWSVALDLEVMGLVL